MASILTALICLFFFVSSIGGSAVAQTPMAAPQIAVVNGIGASTNSCAYSLCLRTNTRPYATIHVQGYYGAGTPGGGDFEFIAAGQSTALDNKCTIFIDAAGHEYERQGGTVGPINVVDCGARGNGVQGTTGIANGTTTFRDLGARFITGTKPAAVGDIFVLVPPYHTTDAALTTKIAAVNSDSSLTLTQAPSYAATGLTYYYGSDDGSFGTGAFSAANAVAGALQTGTPLGLAYANSGVEIEVPGPNIYLHVGQFHVADSAGTAAQMVGVGEPTIAVGGLAAGTDCVNYGYFNRTLMAHLTIDCAYSGTDNVSTAGDGMNWGTGRQTFSEIWDVDILDAPRDCLAIKMTPRASIQQGKVHNLSCGNSGRSCFDVRMTDGSPGTEPYFNEVDWDTITCVGVSYRFAGGTAWDIEDTSNSKSLGSWFIHNWKATSGYQGDPSLMPLGSCINIAASYFLPITWQDGYCEGGGANGLGTPGTSVVRSGSYDSTTGVVTLLLASDINIPANAPFVISGLEGTGSYANAEGTYVTSTGVDSTTGTTTVGYRISPGLTMSITGGTLAVPGVFPVAAVAGVSAPYHVRDFDTYGWGLGKYPGYIEGFDGGGIKTFTRGQSRDLYKVIGTNDSADFEITTFNQSASCGTAVAKQTFFVTLWAGADPYSPVQESSATYCNGGTVSLSVSQSAGTATLAATNNANASSTLEWIVRLKSSGNATPLPQ